MQPLPLPVAAVVAAIGGVATNGAFPSYSWWWAAIAGLALLFLALHGARPGRGFLLGLIWGVAFFAPLLSWSLVSVTGHWLPWVALTLMEAVFIGIFGWLYALAVGREASVGREALVGALLWVAVEQLRMVVPFGGFPWGALPHSQVSGPLLHLAPFGGTVVVGLVVAFVAAALVALVTGFARPVSAIGGAVAAVALVVVAGIVPLPSTEAETGTLRLASVQASVPSRGAEWQSQGAEITTEYRALTEGHMAAGGAPDLVLWPESAADLDPRTNEQVMADVVAAQASAGVPILFGTQRYPGDGFRYNEYLAWGPDGQIDGYAKQHPVPFGEYMPMRDLLRNFSSAVDRVSTDMAAGSEPGILRVPVASVGRDVNVGVGICFEVAYDEILRENVELGAELLVIPTNNASFGYTQEAFQQRDITRFRAVEFGRTAVQSATTGVSAIYGPDGTWLQGSTDELFEQWAGEADVPLRTSQTLTVFMGGWPRIVVWGLSAIWLVAALASARRDDIEEYA